VSRPGTLRVLSDGEVASVHEAALRVLAESGVYIDYPRALEHLAEKGARVDFAARRVRFPRSLVERALLSCPDSFTLYDRDGRAALQVGGDQVHFAPGSCAVRVLDSDGTARPSTARDLVDLVRVADALPQVSLQSTAVVAAEAPKELADSYRLFLVLSHSAKPVVTGAFSEPGLWDMKTLLDAVSDDQAGDAPCAVFDVCPSPPLKWTAISAANVMDGAAANLPIEFVSMPMPGAASPATLAGSVALHAAETLSGVVLAQTVRPGARVVWGGAPVQFDMRYGTTPLSAVEATMIGVASAQLGKHYRLPTHTYAALSDAKEVDAQAGLETALSGVLAALARINVISGLGTLDFENTHSREKLVLDAELAGMVQRLLRGISVSGETLATELIVELGPGADYLGQRHTRRWFREESHLPGAVIDRLERQAWAQSGSPDAWARARKQVEVLLAGHQAPAPPADRAGALAAAMRRIMAAHGCQALPFVER